MEKFLQLLRILFHMKIYPQSCTATLAKKYLETKSVGKLEHEDEAQEKEEDGCKWVKTDSDCMFMCSLRFLISLNKKKKFYLETTNSIFFLLQLLF